MSKIAKPSLIQHRLHVNINVWNWVAKINRSLNTSPIKSDQSIDIELYADLDENIYTEIKRIYEENGWTVSREFTELGVAHLHNGITLLNFKDANNVSITSPTEHSNGFRRLSTSELQNIVGRIGEVIFVTDLFKPAYWDNNIQNWLEISGVVISSTSEEVLDYQSEALTYNGEDLTF